MLAYAANAPRFGERRRSPNALLLIVAAHSVALAAVMSAKMDIPIRDLTGIKIVDVPLPKPVDPPPPPPETHEPVKSQHIQSTVDTVDPVVPVDPVGPIFTDQPIKPPPVGPIVGSRTEYVPPPPIHEVKRIAARFNTPDWALRPPYPDSKRQSEEEATLRLRLSIDDKGRVIAVEPVGNTDPVFLAAARKHLIAKWRYKPATEDGRPVHSSTVVTLRFELEA